MKKLMFLSTTAIALSGCALFQPEVEPICPDQVYINKWETPIDECREDARSVVRVYSDDDGDDRRPEDDGDDDKPDDDRPDDDGEDDNDPKDDDDPKPSGKVKGNNGWGNGDQSAPGKSKDRNNAENRGGGAHRNHGEPNQN